MINIYKTPRFIGLDIKGHFRSDVCNTISTVTQFSQWLYPNMFASFGNGETCIIAVKNNEKIYLKKLINFLTAYFDQNEIEYNIIKNKKMKLIKKKDYYIIEME